MLAKAYLTGNGFFHRPEVKYRREKAAQQGSGDFRL